jgi:diaminohydroxyphosphoribosylaminopyrimidine deaminase / 5-amino-6-(5-phosphoribosylamino)uracil reductase
VGGVQDLQWMRRALAIARRGMGATHPNPRVGAIAVRDGRMIGMGAHLAWGGPHAEAQLLRSLPAGALAGATVYVNLEPCAHTGKTPPCATALVEAGIGRLVAAIVDPHPLVSGRGLGCLRAAGIAVETGVGARAAAELNAPFLWHLRTGQPLLTLKVAASLDGRSAARDGTSRWISGEVARERVHAWRAGVDAVLTGSGTFTSDRPRLNARPRRRPGSRAQAPGTDALPAWPHQPARVLVDSHALCATREAWLDHLATSAGGPWVVACGERASQSAIRALEARGTAVWRLPAGHGGSGVDLAALALELAKHGWIDVLVECGRTLASALVRDRLVGCIRLFQAPMLLGAERTWIGDAGVESLNGSARFTRMRVVRVGDDALTTVWSCDVARCLEEAQARPGAA